MIHRSLLACLVFVACVRVHSLPYEDLFGLDVLEDGIAPWSEVGNPQDVWPNTVAICAIMRDENPEDIRQWIRYHKWLGVDKIILTDNGSIDDIQPFIQDWIDEGFVKYAEEPEPSHQIKTYQKCIDEERLKYSWIAFIDLDEMLIVRERNQNLKSILREYRFFAGLSVHWVMYGSSGRVKRPKGGGMLQQYNQCAGTPFDAVKTIVNTYYVQHTIRHPHNFRYKSMMTSVNEQRYPMETYCHIKGLYKEVGPCLEHMWNAWTGFSQPEDSKRSVNRIALNHYATKSREDFDVKVSRGGGTTRQPKGEDYWETLQEESSKDRPICKEGIKLWESCCKREAANDAAIIKQIRDPQPELIIIAPRNQEESDKLVWL